MEKLQSKEEPISRKKHLTEHNNEERWQDGKQDEWKMRKWCWKTLEEEWKNWQKLVMTEIAKKDNFLAVRQSFSMKTYSVEIHKHDSHILLFWSYEIELKSSFKGSSISWT